MATDNQRRNIRGLVHRFLPDVPLEGSSALQDLLYEMKTRIEQLWQDPDPPAQPTGVTITKNNLGNNVSWNRALKVRRYQAFRNTTGNITTATLLRELPGNDNVSFFDPNDQTTPTRYYWIRGLNAKGDPGPFSAMASATNFYVDPSGTAMGVDAIASGSNSTALGYNAQATAINTTAMGVSAIAAGSGGTALGHVAASGTGNNNTVVGDNSSVAAGKNNSSVFGQLASSRGSSDAVIGRQASSGTGGSNSLVGQNATIPGTGASNVAIGAGASIGTLSTDSNAQNVVVGAASTITDTTSGNSVLVGYGITNSAGANTIVGAGASNIAAGGNNVIIGQGASSTGSSGNNVIVGATAVISATDSVGIGYACNISGNRSTGIGRGITIAHDDCTVIGKGGVSTAAGQVIIGTASATITAVYLGRGVTHTGSAQVTEMHMSDGTGANIAGDTFSIYGGQSTGNAAGGKIRFYASAAGAAGSSTNTAALISTITNTGLGVGTDTPGYPFQVNQSITGDFVAAITNLGAGASDHGLIIRCGNNGASGGAPLGLQDRAGNWLFYQAQNGMAAFGGNTPGSLINPSAAKVVLISGTSAGTQDVGVALRNTVSTGEALISVAGTGLFLAMGNNATGSDNYIAFQTVNTNSSVAVVTRGRVTSTGIFEWGKQGSTTAQLDLLGTTSGNVSVKVADAAGTWTMTLPTTDGNANEVLLTDGSGVTSWTAGQSISGLTTSSTPTFAAVLIGSTPSTTGSVRVANAVTALSARNAANTADLPLVSTMSNNLTKIGGGVCPSVADNGTMNVFPDSSDDSCCFIISETTTNKAALIFTQYNTAPVIVSGNAVYTITQGTAASTNIYWSAARLIVENKTGAAKSYQISMLYA